MAECGARTAREYCCTGALQRRPGRAPHGVDAAMHAVQATDPHAVGDLMPAQAELTELGRRDVSVLSVGER